ncbi:MAG: hypothetical protein HY909_15595 [Deltaproteobacteria bacterium]|nr:hypothetical protein [Deltaproteobacteria bacterium]
MRPHLPLSASVALGALLVRCSPEEATCVEGSCDAPRRDGGNDLGVPPVDAPSRSDAPSVPGFTGLTVEPPEAALSWSTGMPPATVRFRASGRSAAGTATDLTGRVQWSVHDPAVASIARDGTASVAGGPGGATRVIARLQSDGRELTAEARLSVRVTARAFLPGTDPSMVGPFDTAPASDPARSPTIVYPLSDAVMPQNVGAADIQWNPVGGAGDVFRVRLERPFYTLQVFTRSGGDGFRHDLLVPSEPWRALCDADPGAPVTLTVDRLEAASASRAVYASSPVRFRVSRGGLYGAVYYWDLGMGRIQRVDPGAVTREGVIPSPPPRPRDGRRCVACHTVSRTGRYLSAELWDGWDLGTVFDLTADLRADPAPTLFPPTMRYLFSSFNPDASRLLVNTNDALALLDPRTGMTLPAEGLPGHAGHLEWSPNGREVAYIQLPAGGNTVDFTRGDLALLGVEGDRFTPPAAPLHQGMALAGSPEGGAADSHPTWSPDSGWVAFGHGTNSRSGNEGVRFPGALYLSGREPGAPLRLDRANGGAAGRDSYWPTFSPFITQENETTRYFWLAFHSRRDYGNALAGSRGTGRRQLWVTAIDARPAPGRDPSQVPYWLPGQDVRDDNMAAYWAPGACRPATESCRSDSDCCSGRCVSGRCMAPTPGMCRRMGLSCAVNGDCCEGLTCYGNVCGAIPP